MDPDHLDTYLKLFSDNERRQIVHRLRDESAERATVEELVDHLHDGEPAPLTPERQDRDHISLQLMHNHLPKLDEYEVVDYDRESRTVRYQPADRIETVLDSLPTEVAGISES